MNYEIIIVIILLTIMIMFCGGKNHLNTIEFDNDHFENYKNIIIFEEILKKNIPNLKNNDFISIDEMNNQLHILLPNYINNFLIRINKYSYFNINKLINKNKNLIMIIYNLNDNNNLYLVVNKENNTTYNYYINKKISITSIYDIYNDNDFEINLALFIVKKPYWHH